MNGELVGISYIYMGSKLKSPSPDETKEFSIGYHLLPSAWGKGIATEASTRVLRFAFENLGAEVVRAHALQSNSGSIHVLHKIGMKQVPAEDPTYSHFMTSWQDFSIEAIGLISAPNVPAERRSR